jgi:hypothetical protein
MPRILTHPERNCLSSNAIYRHFSILSSFDCEHMQSISHGIASNVRLIKTGIHGRHASDEAFRIFAKVRLAHTARL